MPGFDGHGVTIALLDTGVDASHPYLHGRVLPGIDLFDRGGDALCAREPARTPRSSSAHGTELAGILVGSNGPGGLRGVAPEASVLPIRVAGWQTASDGRELVYGRSDQLIAGLDRAVDPNGDGDEHDAVRVALVGVVEPYAAFTDGPEAQAVQGALDLNTLVVTPAGNDGGAGPAFGSVAGPAGATAALAVAATDARAEQPQVRVVLRRGLDVILRRARAAARRRPRRRARRTSRSSLRARPRVCPARRRSTSSTGAGSASSRARRSCCPQATIPRRPSSPPSRAGAAAVVLYGTSLPAGSLRLSEDATAPAVVIPSAAAVELLAAQRAGLDVGISVGAVHDATNTGRGSSPSSRRRASRTTAR